MSAKISVFIKDPGKNARHVNISATLKNLQNIVGGYVWADYLSLDARILSCKDAAITGQPYNCKICGVRFYGTLIFIGITKMGQEFCDYPIKDTKTMRQLFPQLYMEN